MGAPYEATFLVAVATAYFLALNALVGHLFLQWVRVREGQAALSRDLESLNPRLAELSSLAAWTLETEGEGTRFKGPEDPSHD